MPRLKTGSAVAKKKIRGSKTIKIWFARVTYFDDEGKRREWARKPKSNTKTAAKEEAKRMLQELEGQGKKAIDAANMTFAQLADFYQETYLIDAEYVDGRKVAGFRSKYEFEVRLRVLRNYFRNQKIKEVTHGDLKKFKVVRLKTPTAFGKNTRGTDKPGNVTYRQRSIGTVHKELGLLRRIFNVAVSNGWLIKNPFEMGDSLINPADEKARERIITREEEECLLAACTGWRAHLRPIIICALDTGMRRGEIFKLKWSDIDFENRLINIQALNTKTLRQRQVALSSRLTQELQALWEDSTRNLDALVFGITTSSKKAFANVRKIAGIPDLRFHDLRHTHATRLVSKHLPLAEVGRTLGHTQINTTYRYVNPNVQTAKRVAEIMDELNSAETQTENKLIN
jgi:integrase